MDGTAPTTNPQHARKVTLAHTWHRSLSSAVAEARTTKRPILQLWLLGALDEELSCANSRFFRATLYPDPAVARVLEERFVLCWQSFRPVPVVTIDFGDGRRLVRTLTGNSVHLVLDCHGRPVDALPGVYRPRAFLAGLDWAARLAHTVTTLAEPERRRALALAHRRAAPLPAPPPAPRRATPTAREAGALAMTKMRVEAPLLEGTRDLFESLDEDAHRNERDLHPRVHADFARGAVGPDARTYAHAIYRDLFKMPFDDPWLGLRSGDSALTDDGVAWGTRAIDP